MAQKSDICFMDTETLGLHRAAPIWEFAAIRRTWRDTGAYYDTEFHCFIEHRPNPWLGQMPDAFKADYLARFRADTTKTVLPRWDAVKMILEATSGAHIVGAVPNFDTERIARMLRRCNFDEPWHYHLIDVENMIVGYLRGQIPYLPKEARPAFAAVSTPPYSSDDLSRAIGVDPNSYKRHSAMGDVEWVRAQYDAVMGPY